MGRREMQTTFTTPSGATVELEIETSIQSMGDRNVMEPCWSLNVRVGDKIDRSDIELIDHPEHGLCLATISGPKIYIRVPAEAAAAVRQVVYVYTAEVERRVAALIEASHRDAERAARLSSVRGSAFDANVIAAERRA